MHVLLTYGVNGTPDQIATINTKVGEALKPYAHYRALGNTYIVRANSAVEWSAILQKIQLIAQQSTIPMNFLMTPLVAAGNQYNGWMPKESWDAINKLTQ